MPVAANISANEISRVVAEKMCVEVTLAKGSPRAEWAILSWPRPLH